MFVLELCRVTTDGLGPFVMRSKKEDKQYRLSLRAICLDGTLATGQTLILENRDRFALLPLMLDTLTLLVLSYPPNSSCGTLLALDTSG